MAARASGSYAEDFGQQVDLTQRIREILVSYPEGTTILKELVQNADDAGASTVRSIITILVVVVQVSHVCACRVWLCLLCCPTVFFLGR